jgi:hypothetical protein
MCRYRSNLQQIFRRIDDFHSARDEGEATYTRHLETLGSKQSSVGQGVQEFWPWHVSDLEELGPPLYLLLLLLFFIIIFPGGVKIDCLQLRLEQRFLWLAELPSWIGVDENGRLAPDDRGIDLETKVRHSVEAEILFPGRTDLHFETGGFRRVLLPRESTYIREIPPHGKLVPNAYKKVVPKSIITCTWKRLNCQGTIKGCFPLGQY